MELENNSDTLSLDYNWDNLEIGRYDLNHSEHFFDFKHSKHEIFNFDLKAEQSMDEVDVKENQSQSSNQLSQDPLEESKIKKELKTCKQDQNENEDKTSTLQNHFETQKSNEMKIKILKERQEEHLPTNRLLKIDKVPKALNYVGIYETKKKEKLKQQLEEDKKSRIFQSRPAPNFSVAHQILSRRLQSKIKVTAPTTPKVLKHSFNSIEKSKKLEELKKQSVPTYHAKEPKVLNQKPFVPVKKEPCHIEIQPFNLHVEKRLTERKHFDEIFQKKMEEKRKKEEEERLRREEELSKELRKMTTFKARPNPFK